MELLEELVDTGELDPAKLMPGTGTCSLADAIVRLYHDRELWEKLAAGGRENIRRYFSRDVARSAITRLIALADGHRAARLGSTDRKFARKMPSAD